MSVAKASGTEFETIFVRLLGEGTDVMRPVHAEKIGVDKFRLLRPADYDPDFENWEFVPESVVECETRYQDGDEFLVAVRQI